MAADRPNISGMVTLKIDNLSFDTNEGELESTFKRYGEIGDVFIPRHRDTKKSRGFAFVRFFEDRDAKHAINDMDGRKLDDREIRVSLGMTPRPDSLDAPHDGDRQQANGDMSALIQQLDVQLPQQPVSSPLGALPQHQLALSGAERVSGPPNIEGMVSLKVDNIPFEANERELESKFSKYGEIGDVFIPRYRDTGKSRGFAFVRFKDDQAAKNAIEGMDGRKMHDREIRVSHVQTPRPLPQEGGGYGKRRSRSRSRSPRRRRSRSRSRSRSPRRRRSRSRSQRRSSSRSRSWLPSGGTTQFQGRAGDWECVSCRYANFAYRNDCNQCKRPRRDRFQSSSAGGPRSMSREQTIGRVGDWECRPCQYPNFAYRTECNQCRRPRDKCQMKEQRMTENSRDGDWECGPCQYKNFAYRAECNRCGQIKDKVQMKDQTSLAEASSMAPRERIMASLQAIGRDGDWECVPCRYSNFAYRTECYRCRQPRDKCQVQRLSANSRDGDWECGPCQYKNFAYRAECNQCREPKDKCQTKEGLNVQE